MQLQRSKKRIVACKATILPEISQISQTPKNRVSDSAPHNCDSGSDLIPAARSTGTSSVVFGAVPFPGCSLNEACSHPPTLDSARLYRFYYCIMPELLCQEESEIFSCIISQFSDRLFVPYGEFRYFSSPFIWHFLA